MGSPLSLKLPCALRSTPTRLACPRSSPPRSLQPVRQVSVGVQGLRQISLTVRRRNRAHAPYSHVIMELDPLYYSNEHHLLGSSHKTRLHFSRSQGWHPQSGLVGWMPPQPSAGLRLFLWLRSKRESDRLPHHRPFHPIWREASRRLSITRTEGCWEANRLTAERRGGARAVQ